MPCYHPIEARQLPAGGPLSFPRGHQDNFAYLGWKKLQIPCMQCHGCKLTYSRHWAARCMHHSKMHRYNSYLTLTYDSDHLPDFNLHYADHQAFIRRLRKAAFRARMDSPLLIHRGRELTQRERDFISNGAKSANQENAAPLSGLEIARMINKSVQPNISFYMGGEYGEQNGRPHFHTLLFGLDFADLKYHKTSPSGAKLYRSATLEKLWPMGYSSVGRLTFESAAYVARYVFKKYTGDGNKLNYNIIDLETGEIQERRKEFVQMSRHNAIGKSWLMKYMSDVYTTGKMVIRGHEENPPRYYDKLFKRVDEQALQQFKHARALAALVNKEHHTPERLAVQEQVSKARTTSLQRGKLTGVND